MTFRDRRQAGQLLAARLSGMSSSPPVVIALPRGGVPVGFEVARSLGAPLDVVVVRKVAVPWQPELALGAVGEGGVRISNDDVARQVRLPASVVAEEIRRSEQELTERLTQLRGSVEPVDVSGRSVLLIDDGIATGATARAAIAVLRARGANRIVLAVPVAASEAVQALRGAVDDMVCLTIPRDLSAIGFWYDDFGQVDDAEVRRLLTLSRRDVVMSGGRDAAAGGTGSDREVSIPIVDGSLPGRLVVPAEPVGLVLFAHGSGSSRHSPRNVAVAERLHAAHLATLLFDLLLAAQERDRRNVFDMPLLVERLVAATVWAQAESEVAAMPLWYFGASTGAAAALWAAAQPGARVQAVVSRGGRVDLATPVLDRVTAATLFIVGGADRTVLTLNQQAQRLLRCENRLVVIPGASHLFEEPGALDAVADLTAAWFVEHFAPDAVHPPGH